MNDTKHSAGHTTADNAGTGHEVSDLKPRTIAIFGTVLATTVILCLVVTMWLFGYFAAREAKRDVPPSPLAKIEAPPEPRLQVAAPKDLAEFRAAEEKMLNGYDWVNRQAGTVRIPIDRAMRLLAERGLPAPSPPSQPSQPTKAKRR